MFEIFEHYAVPWCEQLAKCVSAEQDKTFRLVGENGIAYCLAKYIQEKRLSPSQCVSLVMLLLNNYIQQHYLSPAKLAHLIYISTTLIGRVFKLPSFPLFFRQVTEAESNRHVNTSYTHPVSSLTYHKDAINKILQLALIVRYFELL